MTRKHIDDRSHQSMIEDELEDEQNELIWENRRPALLFNLFKEVQNSKCHLDLEEEGDRNDEYKITFYFNRSSGNTITSLELECSEAEYTEAYVKVTQVIRKEKADEEAEDQKAVNAAWSSLTPAQQRKLYKQLSSNTHLKQEMRK